ncbi:sugar ABC transporter permease [Nonomuraea dietziae]|uniref:carbohydrate ABC transporter permease n=1 Tax=Nonomuraea dietziae TaxID=65515 RepID=UPI0031D0231F
MHSKREWAWGYLLIAPMALGLAVFYLWPIVQTLYLSMTESGVFGGYTWVGTANFADLFTDEEMYGALANTLLYAVLVLAGVPLSIVVAALLNVPGLRGLSLYRTLYFLPVVTMPAAVALTWSYLFNGDFGAINHVLGTVGIDGPYWLGDPDFAIYAIAVVGIWSSIGYNAVLFLAGLQGIPRHYYEAAEIDGARAAAAVLPHHAAAAHAHHVLRHGHNDDQRAAGLRPRLSHDRPEEPSPGGQSHDRLPVLRDGLRAEPAWARRDDRRHPARADPGADRVPVQATEEVGAL